MAKQTGSKNETKAATEEKKVEKPYLSFELKDVPKLITGEDELPVEFQKVNKAARSFELHLAPTEKGVINMLNKFTDDMRKAFQKASLPGWKVFFYVNGGRYVSTL